MIINVTDDDVRDGVPQDELRCPLARAIGRQLGVAVAVMEDGWVEEDVEPAMPLGQLGERAVRAILVYDRTGTMVPGEYEILLQREDDDSVAALEYAVEKLLKGSLA